jgi:hypothetical protein
VYASSGAWFQRPYPYHLDYYKTRFGGTYEPYYNGGMYGPPMYVAPFAYDYGFGPPYGGGYLPPGLGY